MNGTREGGSLWRHGPEGPVMEWIRKEGAR